MEGDVVGGGIIRSNRPAPPSRPNSPSGLLTTYHCQKPRHLRHILYPNFRSPSLLLNSFSAKEHK